MTSANKNKIKGLLSAFCIALYFAVFIGSDYLHHHELHETSNVVSISKDSSCDLCKTSPQKIWGHFSTDFHFIKNTIDVSPSQMAENTFSAFLVQQLNKAPPVA